MTNGARQQIFNFKFVKILIALFLTAVFLSLPITELQVYYTNTFGQYSFLVVGIAVGIRGFLGFTIAPFFGQLSDRAGRKWPIFFTMLGNGIPFVFVAVYQNINVFIVLFAAGGIFYTTYGLLWASISDTVNPDARTRSFSVATAVSVLGAFSGISAGGGISVGAGSQAVFYTTALMVVITLTYMALCFPETQMVSSQASFKLVFSNPFRPLLKVYSRPKLRRLFSVTFFTRMGSLGLLSQLLLYLHQALHFSPFETSLYLGVVGVLLLFSLLLLLPLVSRRFAGRDLIVSGLFSGAVYCLVVALAQAKWMLWLGLVCVPIWAFQGPTVMSLVSEEGDQGLVMGALSGVGALVEAISPILFGILLTLMANSSLPGGGFLLAVIFQCIALRLAWQLPSNTGATLPLQASHMSAEADDFDAENASFIVKPNYGSTVTKCDDNQR
jgi:DHA1 family tetracycline resistance protein-like MFS transporter